MSTPTADPPATGTADAASDRTPWLVIAAVVGVALLVVLLVVSWAGGGRAEPGPRSVAEIESAIRAGGLVVCSARPVADPSGAGAVEARALEVGSTDAGVDAAAGLDGYGGETCAPRSVADVVVTRFADVDARDAAARSVEGLVRPRGSAALYTAGDLTILVRGTSEDAPRDRLDEVLRGAGAR